MTRARSSAGSAGFTLIEMAVAVLAIGLILGGMLVPLVSQVEQRQVSETEKILQDARDALVGHAVANGYLPCPDKTGGGGAGTPNDGAEDVDTTTGVCVVTEGNLPWVTLGTGRTDAWGNRLHYEVHTDFARRAPGALFSLSTVANLRVCINSGCAGANLLTNTAAVVLFSHGKNGYGAINAATGTANTAPTSTDEIDNTDGGTRFIFRPITGPGSSAGEFDDIFTWISRYTLAQRMVAAGKLP